MRAAVQRVKRASVSVDGENISRIERGLLILLGVKEGDEEGDCPLLAKKLASMRIFSDGEGKMNLSVKDIGGQALAVSQFTLFADCRRGNRPSFSKAAPPETANALFVSFVRELEKELGEDKVKRGVFGADMAVELINDGPVTIILDSEDLKKSRRDRD